MISDIEPFAYPGGQAELTIDLFNVGIGTAKYVVVEANSEAGSFEQEKVFIGTLEADDFDSFKLDISVAPNTDPNKDQNITLLLKYKNQYGEERQVQKILSLKIYGAGEVAGTGNPILMIFGIFMLAMQLLGLFIAGRWVYKRFIKKTR